MATTIKRLLKPEHIVAGLFGVTAAPNAVVEVYRNIIFDSTTIVKEITICNPSAVDARITIAIKGENDAMDRSNALFYEANILAGQTAIISLSSILAFGKGLFVKATGATLNVHAEGVEILKSSAKQLVCSLIPTALTTIYTAPENKINFMYELFAVNTDFADVTMSLQIVPVNGVNDARNEILHEVTIKPNETLMYTTKMPLPSGYRLVAKASKANVINVVINGTEK